jgi:hypothetical protein
VILILSSFLRTVDQQCREQYPTPEERTNYFLTKALPSLQASPVTIIREKYNQFLRRRQNLDNGYALQRKVATQFFNQTDYSGTLGYCDCKQFYQNSKNDYNKLNEEEKALLDSFQKFE